MDAEVQAVAGHASDDNPQAIHGATGQQNAAPANLAVQAAGAEPAGAESSPDAAAAELQACGLERRPSSSTASLLSDDAAASDGSGRSATGALFAEQVGCSINQT